MKAFVEVEEADLLAHQVAERQFAITSPRVSNRW
jgi:hypothetical protein